MGNPDIINKGKNLTLLLDLKVKKRKIIVYIVNLPYMPNR